MRIVLFGGSRYCGDGDGNVNSISMCVCVMDMPCIAYPFSVYLPYIFCSMLWKACFRCFVGRGVVVERLVGGLGERLFGNKEGFSARE